ncbi:AraC family transcriptional regulator [Clostridia bacterium]|nr:AraC family transcriptional regulator [Clostridia bacterium]
MVDKKTQREIHDIPINGMFPIEVFDWHGNADTNYMLECHWHNEWEIFVLTKGRAYFVLDGNKTLMSENDIAFIPANRLHRAECIDQQPFYYRAIVFSADFLGGYIDLVQTKYVLPLFEQKLRVGSFFSGDERFLKVFDKICAAYGLAQPFYEMIIKGCMYELLALLLSMSNAQETLQTGVESASGKIIRESMQFIHDNLSAKMTIENLSKRANMSEGYFSRLFKQYTSHSPIDYIIDARMSKACQMIARSDEKLSNIARDTGFNNVSYFVRTFTAFSGCPPSEYRRRQRETAQENTNRRA